MTRPFRPREIYAVQPAIARIHEELALIAEYEQGLEDGRPAYLGAMWRVDWEMELALMTRQKGAEMLYGNVGMRDNGEVAGRPEASNFKAPLAPSPLEVDHGTKD